MQNCKPHARFVVIRQNYYIIIHIFYITCVGHKVLKKIVEQKNMTNSMLKLFFVNNMYVYINTN